MDNIDAIVFDLDNTLMDTTGADKLAFDKVHQMLHSNYPIFDNPRQVIETFKSVVIIRFSPITIAELTPVSLFSPYYLIHRIFENGDIWKPELKMNCG